MKIYGTLGPACSDVKTLKAMFLNGMTGMRLNLSHTTLHDAGESIDKMHHAAEEAGLKAELLIDMQGPELRIGPMEKALSIQEGETVLLTDDGSGDISIPEEAAVRIRRGQELLLDDGKISCRVTDISDRQICAEVLRGGILSGRKSLALPGVEVPMPALTELDRINIRCAQEYGVTGIMQPFVRSPQDLKEVREELEKAGQQEIRLFAKIENTAGLDQIQALIPWADEIVIARGDLGNAMELWDLPAAQKKLASACRKAGRDFMVVTQMLSSMEHRAVPTRAEVSDIFNAVLDGASSVMVTGETAVGNYPVEVIRYLTNTVRAAKEYMENK